MALIIGNPTNIYLATSAGIGFVEYLKYSILPTIFGGGAAVSVPTLFAALGGLRLSLTFL